MIAGGVMGGALRTAGETPEVVAGMLPSAGTAVNVIKKSIELAQNSVDYFNSIKFIANQQFIHYYFNTTYADFSRNW